jgi:hypothetical protein
MTHLATRATVRTLAVALALALVAGSALALHRGTEAVRAQRVGLPDRAAVLSAAFSALNNGDVDGAAGFFASNAVAINPALTGNCSQTTPCTDAAGIRQQLSKQVTNHQCRVLRSISVSGAVVTGQLEDRADPIRSNGIDYVLRDFIALVPTTEITFIATLDDAASPQTALNTAIAAGSAQPTNPPIPNPATPCAGVSAT